MKHLEPDAPESIPNIGEEERLREEDLLLPLTTVTDAIEPLAPMTG